MEIPEVVKDPSAFKYGAPCHDKKVLLITFGEPAGAFGNVQHDAERSALQLVIGNRVSFGLFQKLHYIFVQLLGFVVNVQSLKIEHCV